MHHIEPNCRSTPCRGSSPANWRLILPLTLLLLASLACGGFQVRVTPTVTPPPTETPEPEQAPTDAIPTPTATQETQATATVIPTVEATATPQTPTGLAVGGAAKINAAGGLNVREQASRSAKQVGKLNSGVVVTLIGGPAEADGYTWWQVDNGSGLKGWVAAGTASDPWLLPPNAGQGGSKLVNRPIELGDQVQVTTQGNQVLTVRDGAGLGSTAIARVIKGTEFTVRGGPVRENEMLWWQLEGEKVNGWAAEGQGEDRWLTPVGP